MRRQGLSQLRGTKVVAQQEAVSCGTVRDVLLDPESKTISALALRDKRSSKSLCVPYSEVVGIGPDVVLIAKATSAEPLDDVEHPGQHLRSLSGMRVVTEGGAFLGKLEDLDFDREHRTLSKLLLTNHQSVDVDPTEITIGPDAIVVPSAYAERMTEIETPRSVKSKLRAWKDRLIGSEEERQRSKRVKSSHA